MKRFQIPRPVSREFAEKLKSIDPVRGTGLAKNLECSLMAIPLVAHEALTTAYMNDVDSLGVFAQQLFGYGRAGDVFLGISTSGNSQNILHAVVVAKAMGIPVIGLTGGNGGELAKLVDVVDIKPLADNESVSRELVLVKVRADGQNRQAIIGITDIFRAKIIDVGIDSLIIELTGNQSKIDAFIRLLEGYEILELARTGITGLSRGAEDVRYL